MDNHKNIDAIFLDLGNTLRILVKDEPHMAEARRKLAALVNAKEPAEAFFDQINARYKIYRKWAFEQLTEAPELDLWTRWLLPDFPYEQIAPLSGELTFLFRQSMGRREMAPGGKEVVIELDRRGYCLGIISNVITVQEIPDWLAADGLTPYFKSVVLSSVFGKRKPDPAIYLEAARIAEVDPARCVYVGDNLKRDVTGTRAAGFGMVVILISPDELAEAEASGAITDENRPDFFIYEFNQLLDIFPARNQPLTASLPEKEGLE